MPPLADLLARLRAATHEIHPVEMYCVRCGDTQAAAEARGYPTLCIAALEARRKEKSDADDISSDI